MSAFLEVPVNILERELEATLTSAAQDGTLLPNSYVITETVTLIDILTNQPEITTSRAIAIETTNIEQMTVQQSSVQPTQISLSSLKPSTIRPTTTQESTMF